jgi:hemicentin
VAPGNLSITVDNVAARGDNVTFACSSSGGPNNSYQWFMNNNTVMYSDTLHLTSVDAGFGGNYICLVTNLAGRETSSVTLYIEPYITVYPIGYLEIELSDPAMFVCDAEGFPAPDVNWVKIAGEMNAIVPSTAGNLTFLLAKAEDNGTYVCQAAAQTQEGVQLQTALTAGSALIGMSKWRLIVLCAEIFLIFF